MGKNKQSIDYVLLATVGIILTIGLAVLWSASTSEAKQTFGSTNYFVIHQLTPKYHYRLQQQILEGRV